MPVQLKHGTGFLHANCRYRRGFDYEQARCSDQRRVGDIYCANTTALARKNAMLVIFGPREAEGKALETELCEFGMNAVFVRAGPTCDGEIHRYMDQAVDCIGHIDDAARTPVHQRRF